MAEPTPRELVVQLIAELRLIAGRSGASEFLERLKTVEPYRLQGDGGLNPDLPLPMFFDDGWQEVFDLLITEANKA